MSECVERNVYYYWNKVKNDYRRYNYYGIMECSIT